MAEPCGGRQRKKEILQAVVALGLAAILARVVIAAIARSRTGRPGGGSGIGPDGDGDGDGDGD